MAGVVQQVKQNVHPNCLAKKCQKKGCSLNLKGAPTPHILIDLDDKRAPQHNPKQKKCDYISLGGSAMVWLAPMEFKKGKPIADRVVPQLKAGANLANQLVSKQCVKFRPVAVYSGELTRIEREKFSQKSNRVPFRGKGYLVKLVCSKTQLVRALVD